MTPVHYVWMLDPSLMQAARVAAGLSLRAVADVIGVTHWTVGRYESGEIDVPGSVVAELATLYRRRPSAFYRRVQVEE